MSKRIQLLIVALSLTALSLGCSPRSRTKVEKKPVTPTERNSYTGRTRTPPRREQPKNWGKLEQGIRDLDQRIAKALRLIEQASGLKKQHDSATGEARKSLRKEVGRVYADAGDVYDMIIEDVDAIEAREKIKDGQLMRRGPRLSAFTRKWERQSKPIKRMAFR